MSIELTQYYDEYLRYFELAKRQQDLCNLGNVPYSQSGVNDSLMENVELYDVVERKYAGFSQIINDCFYGWPEAGAFGVAVARNIHKGEIGDAIVESATMPFLKAHPIADTMPVPSTAAYDAKAWEGFVQRAAPGAIFINVGSDQHIKRNLSSVDVSTINSNREWHDMIDMDRCRMYKTMV